MCGCLQVVSAFAACTASCVYSGLATFCLFFCMQFKTKGTRPAFNLTKNTSPYVNLDINDLVLQNKDIFSTMLVKTEMLFVPSHISFSLWLCYKR